LKKFANSHFDFLFEREGGRKRWKRERKKDIKGEIIGETEGGRKRKRMKEK
jgi:hypothetical protein